MFVETFSLDGDDASALTQEDMDVDGEWLWMEEEQMEILDTRWHDLSRTLSSPESKSITWSTLEFYRNRLLSTQ